MRERVCIVLNEREPQKARAVEALLQRLSEYNITASRLEPSEKLSQIIAQRQPRVLILDYLLEGYGTGLDILSSLNSIAESKRPKAIFLTDEPSVPVAVEAMRLGACNYFELENPQSISRLARETFEILQNSSLERPAIQVFEYNLDDLLAHSQSSHKLVAHAKTIVAKAAPVIVIEGAAGSGRTTWAKALYQERKLPTCIQTLDLANSCEDFSEIKLDDETTLISRNKFIIIKNAQEDDGSLLDLIGTNFEKLWPGNSMLNNNLQIAVCSDHSETTRAWQKATQADLLKLPSLSERKEDIPLLVQRFTKEALELSGFKIKPFSSDLIGWIGELHWPGEIKQLKATIVDAAIESALSDLEPKLLIEELRENWQAQMQSTNYCEAVNPLAAAMALEIAGGNHRLAAAKLGISIRDLRARLS